MFSHGNLYWIEILVLEFPREFKGCYKFLYKKIIEWIYMIRVESSTWEKYIWERKKCVTKNPNVPKKKVTHLDQLKFYIFFNKSVIIY